MCTLIGSVIGIFFWIIGAVAAHLTDDKYQKKRDEKLKERIKYVSRSYIEFRRAQYCNEIDKIFDSED